MRNDAAHVSVRNRPHFWHRYEQFQHAPQFSLKVDAEASPLPIVPPGDRFDLACGSRREPYNPCTAGQRRRALSSSTEMVASSLGSARRRSNSSRCQSGTGSSLTDAARLFQISSTRRRRSSEGSSRISASSAGRFIYRNWGRRRAKTSVAPRAHDYQPRISQTVPAVALPTVRTRRCNRCALSQRQLPSAIQQTRTRLFFGRSQFHHEIHKGCIAEPLHPMAVASRNPHHIADGQRDLRRLDQSRCAPFPMRVSKVLRPGANSTSTSTALPTRAESRRTEPKIANR